MSASDATQTGVWASLGASAKALLKNPRLYILGIIVEYVANGITSLLVGFLTYMTRSFAIASEAPAVLAESLINAGAAIGGVAFVIIDVVVGVLESLVAAAGPFAPAVLIVLAALTYRALLEVLALVGPLGTDRLVDAFRRVMPW